MGPYFFYHYCNRNPKQDQNLIKQKDPIFVMRSVSVITRLGTLTKTLIYLKLNKDLYLKL